MAKRSKPPAAPAAQVPCDSRLVVHDRTTRYEPSGRPFEMVDYADSTTGKWAIRHYILSDGRRLIEFSDDIADVFELMPGLPRTTPVVKGINGLRCVAYIELGGQLWPGVLHGPDVEKAPGLNYDYMG